jgi:hypothetical protein
VFLCRIVQEMGMWQVWLVFVYMIIAYGVLYSIACGWCIKFFLLKIELNKFLKYMLIMHAKCLEENILIFC